MNDSVDQRRRTLLRFSLVAGAAAFSMTMTPLAKAGTQFATLPRTDEVLSSKTLMHVAYRTSLRDPADSFEINLGAWSSPFMTRDGRTFRVQIVPGPPMPDPRLGPSFTLVLADNQGRELDRMNLGNSATATFSDQVIQFYIARL